jgi:Asp-tRNA(Asn)/Glu-tRNA(Gln) amidotransferase A subunit family amidase
VWAVLRLPAQRFGAVAATAAFPHNHNPNRDERTVVVNGAAAPYAEQLFFAGLASLSYLPATAAPIGLTGEGLPVGLQIIGREGEDSTTIEFARLLAAEIAASCRRRHMRSVATREQGPTAASSLRRADQD